MTALVRTRNALPPKTEGRGANPNDPVRNPLAGRRVAVTGGSAGLGLALVGELLSRRAQVAFVARKRDWVERVQQRIGGHGIVGDVSSKDDIYPIVLQVLGALGGPPVMPPQPAGLWMAQLCWRRHGPELRRACDHVLGPFRLTRALLGSLAASARETGSALVLNISRDAAINAYPRWGAYGASKAALQHMTRIWGEELKSAGIHFLSVDPGDMDTALHRTAMPGSDPSTLKRPEAAAHEIAETIAKTLVQLPSTLQEIHGSVARDCGNRAIVSVAAGEGQVGRAAPCWGSEQSSWSICFARAISWSQMTRRPCQPACSGRTCRLAAPSRCVSRVAARSTTASSGTSAPWFSGLATSESGLKIGQRRRPSIPAIALNSVH